MLLCKNKLCDEPFLPCAKKWSDDPEVGNWGIYACSEDCAKIYVEEVKASRAGYTIGISTEDVVSQIKEDAVDNLTKYRIEERMKKQTVGLEEPIEVKSRPTYKRKQKGIIENE